MMIALATTPVPLRGLLALLAAESLQGRVSPVGLLTQRLATLLAPESEPVVTVPAAEPASSELPPLVVLSREVMAAELVALEQLPLAAVVHSHALSAQIWGVAQGGPPLWRSHLLPAGLLMLNLPSPLDSTPAWPLFEK